MRPIGILINKKGSIFIITMLVGVSLLILVSSFIAWLVLEYGLTGRSHDSANALALAEAAVERGIYELNDGGWTNPANGSVHNLNVNSFTSSSGNVMGSYSVAANVDASGLPITVTGTGSVPSSAAPRVQRTVRVMLEKHAFQWGVFSESDLTFTGNSTTDSFDSDVAAYNATSPKGTSGDIGSNGGIDLNGNVTINGSATPGPGETVSTTGGVTVTGSTSPIGEDVVIDPVLIPGGLLPGTAINLNGNDTLPLTTGTYFFTSIKATGNSTIVINSAAGPVIIYTNGDIDVHGNAFVNAGAPTDFQIYSTGDDIDFTGNAVVNAAIYAPNADVHITGNATILGAVTCDQFRANGNVDIHHDLACRRLNNPFSRYVPYSWQET